MASPKSKPSILLGSFSIRPEMMIGTILLLAFTLRLVRLTLQPLWWDEGYSLFFATRDLPTLLDQTALDIHPPLYYAMLQAWIYFAGTSDYVVRFFSVAIGTLTIAYIERLARLVHAPLSGTTAHHTPGIIAAFVFAIAPIEIYYSQEVRMYGLVTLLCLVSTYFFVRLLQKQERYLWLGYLLASSAALYTQYYAGFILVFQLIYLIVVLGQTPRRLVPWLICWLSIAVLYIPWIAYAGGKLYGYVTFKVGHEAYLSQGPISFIAQHIVAFSVGHLSAFLWLDWAALLLLVLVLLGLSQGISSHLAPRQIHNPKITNTLLVSLYLLIPLLLGYLVNVGFPFHPIRYERLLLLATPPFFLLVSSGLLAIPRPAFRTIAIVAVVSVSAFSLFDYYTVLRYPNDDYRPLIQQVQSLAQSGDNLLAIYPWQVGYLQSYYSGAHLNIVQTPNDEWTRNPSQMDRDLKDLLVRNPRVWLPALQTLGRIIEDSLDAQLRPADYSVLDTWYGTTRLELFQRAEDPPISSEALRFDSSELSNWGVSANSVVSGRDILYVWFASDKVAQNKVSMRLFDAKGNLWAQSDRDIDQSMPRQRFGLPIPFGTPPGSYDLRLAFYRDINSASEAISVARVSVMPNDRPDLAWISHSAQYEFANGMRLVGNDSVANPIKPGLNSGITLFWQSTQSQKVDYAVSIRLSDFLGKTWLESSGVIARGIYGTSQWHINEMVRDPHIFTVPGDIPDGSYTLEIALLDPASHSPIGNPVQLTQVQVKGRPHYFGAPAPPQRSDMRLDDIARLAGYGLDFSGRNLQVALYWQAQGRGQIAYQVFVHVVDASGKILAQQDRAAGTGESPTTTWVKGEYLIDEFDLDLPPNVVEYQIRVGMYDPNSGARLSVFDASGAQVGDFVTIR